MPLFSPTVYEEGLVLSSHASGTGWRLPATRWAANWRAERALVPGVYDGWAAAGVATPGTKRRHAAVGGFSDV